MKTIEYRTRDKSSWGDGPWQGEPDKVQWEDPATRLPCLIVRNRFGALCGYVGVPEGHPLHGKAPGEVDLAVHGGVTFAGGCQAGDPSDFEGGEAVDICHVTEAGDPDGVHWFGFDCAHFMDLCPDGGPSLSSLRRGVYRDIAYVRSEVESLAKQLHEMKAC